MEKKMFGFNLDIELKKRLTLAAKNKYTNSSNLLNQILAKWLDEYEGVKKVKEEREQSIEEITPEQHLADWEWRKQQVTDGKLPDYMAEEYPNTSKGDADKGFDDSLTASILEKE